MKTVAGGNRHAALRRYVSAHETKLRFLVVGAFNTIVGLAAFPVLYALTRPVRLHYMLVLVASNVFCQAVAFLTSKHFVFRTRGRHLAELGRFVVLHLAHLLLNLLALPVLVEALGMNPVWAQLLFAVAVVISSYFWHSRITFSAVRTPDL